MSYNDDELTEERSFRASADEDMDDSLEPLEEVEPGSLDFEDEDPDSRYH
jgi:hypothetical protein